MITLALTAPENANYLCHGQTHRGRSPPRPRSFRESSPPLCRPENLTKAIATIKKVAVRDHILQFHAIIDLPSRSAEPSLPRIRYASRRQNASHRSIKVASEFAVIHAAMISGQLRVRFRLTLPAQTVAATPSKR
jgi:hypothetical protein